MKNQYIAPEMEIIEFENEDVITTSLVKSNNPVQDFPNGSGGDIQIS
ncbi:MAG: hypothetical protein J5851_07280 [Oscillospiraceae bacterium]|nr:hypothetical protein [Oscillospiraceae bacterium]